MSVDYKSEHKKAVDFLKRIQKHHKWVAEQHIWHLEANAQVGLFRLLKELDEFLEKNQ